MLSDEAGDGNICRGQVPFWTRLGRLWPPVLQRRSLLPQNASDRRKIASERGARLPLPTTHSACEQPLVARLACCEPLWYCWLLFTTLWYSFLQFGTGHTLVAQLACCVGSLSILGPQSQQGQRVLLHAEDSTGGGIIGASRCMRRGAYEEMMRGNNPDSHLRILTILI